MPTAAERARDPDVGRRKIVRLWETVRQGIATAEASCPDTDEARRQALHEVSDINDEVRQRAHAVLAALDEIEANVRRLIEESRT